MKAMTWTTLCRIAQQVQSALCRSRTLAALISRRLPRPFRSTCWAILHGVIGVNAFIYHTHQQPNRLRPDPATRLCTNPACLASGIHENISHTFIDCPAAAPAIDWLLQTWQQLFNAPAPPPRTAAVLLADDIEAWPIAHRPSGPALDLWTRLYCLRLGLHLASTMPSHGCRYPS